MVGCTAPYCNNSSEQGYVMKSLPTNDKLREIWIKNINRRYKIKDWAPAKNSRLCEVHFAPEMWENKRLDNLQKLRRNAVPTIFGYHITKKTFIARESKSSQTDNVDNSLPLRTGAPVFKRDQSTSTEEECDSKKLLSLKKQVNSLRNRIKSVRLKNQVLLDVLKTDKYRTALYKVFNEDQVQCLISEKKIYAWSQETIKRAIKLRAMCGGHGYDELKSQGIPLPCLRVLQRSQPPTDSLPDSSQATTISSEQLLSLINDDWEDI